MQGEFGQQRPQGEPTATEQGGGWGEAQAWSWGPGRQRTLASCRWNEGLGSRTEACMIHVLVLTDGEKELPVHGVVTTQNSGLL